MLRPFIACAPVSRVLAVALGLAATPAAQIVFEPPVVTSLDHPLNGVCAADLDLDGNVDLITAPSGAGYPYYLPEFSVMLGQGDGTFGAPADYELVWDYAGSGVVADLNGDPYPDFVYVVHTDGMPIPYHSVQLRYGAGDGTFPALKSIGGSQTEYYGGVVPIDLTGDGKVDLVVLSVPFFSAKLHSFIVDANGEYTHVDGPTLNGIPSGYALGDVNGDTLPDFVMTKPSSGIDLAPGQPDGHFGAPHALALGVSGTFGSVVLHDLDGDGSLDMVVSESTSGGRLDTFLGDGLGHFVLLQALPGQNGSIAAGQLDADGNLDLLVKGQDALRVLRGAGDGTFSFVTGVTVGTFGGAALADFDNDGFDDAAMVQSSGVIHKIGVIHNATYPPGSPFSDLGNALPGSKGYPIQLADGALQVGTPVSIALANGLPLAAATLVLGLSQANLPFKGGVMVPAPSVLIDGLLLDASGATTLAGPWPPGVPSGFTFYTQFWFKDPAAPTHAASSTGVRVVAP